MGKSKLSGVLGNQAQFVHTHNPDKRSHLGSVGTQTFGSFFSLTVEVTYIFFCKLQGMAWNYIILYTGKTEKKEVKISFTYMHFDFKRWKYERL